MLIFTPFATMVDFDADVDVVDVNVVDNDVHVVEVYADVDDLANLVKEFDVGCALAVVIFDSNCFKPATNE